MSNQPGSAQALLKQSSSLVLRKRIEPSIAEIVQASDAILSNATAGKIGEASDLLLDMQGHIAEIAQDGNWLARIVSSQKNRLVRKFKKMHNLKTVIEEQQNRLIAVRDSLEKSIEKMETLRDQSKQFDNDLGATITALKTEQLALEDCLTTATEQEQVEIRQAIQRYKKTIADLIGWQSTSATNAAQISIALQGREILYESITTMAPQVRALLAQTTALAVFNSDTANAIAVVNQTAKSLNELIKITSDQSKANALATAEIAARPVILVDTIEHIAGNMVDTIRGVREVFDKAHAEYGQIEAAAAASRDRITQALSEHTSTNQQ